MNAQFRMALSEIAAYFRAEERMAFNRKELEELLETKRQEWRFRHNYSVSAFIDSLAEANILKKRELQFLRHKYQVYAKKGKVDIFELVGKASDKGYFSHLSAIYLHDLCVQIPNSIYISIMQPRVREERSAMLNQADIDNSFAKEARLTNAFTKLMLSKKQWTIYQLFSTKYHDDVNADSVESFNYDEDTVLRRSTLERTLIDACIRPEYSGGIEILREAFQNAQPCLSANKLASILRSMKTVYPYHQALGFWMELCGNYSNAQLSILKRMPQEYDFYLIRGLKKEDLKYNESWRIYYPSYLEL